LGFCAEFLTHGARLLLAQNRKQVTNRQHPAVLITTKYGRVCTVHYFCLLLFNYRSEMDDVLDESTHLVNPQTFKFCAAEALV